MRHVFAGEINACRVQGTSETRPQVLLPGAFNPLHRGHRNMATRATELTGNPVCFEISIENVDKSALNEQEVRCRLGQFSEKESIWLTRAATFVEKSEIFPGALFAIGIDTLQRIASLRYYEDRQPGNSSQARMQRAIEQIAANGCQFLVFGRLIGKNFRGVKDLALGDCLMSLCHEIPESLFREDISSAQLRDP
jgi:hypothetical protein